MVIMMKTGEQLMQRNDDIDRVHRLDLSQHDTSWNRILFASIPLQTREEKSSKNLRHEP